MKRIFFVAFFISLHYASLLYVTSTFLDTVFSPLVGSLLIMTGAFFSMMFFIGAPRLIDHVSVKGLFLISTMCAIVTSGSIPLNDNPTAIALLYLLYSPTLYLMFYCLDILLEEKSTDSSTGGVRGAYLTLINLGIIGGPLLVSIFALGENLLPIYLMGAVILVPSFLIGLFIRDLKQVGTHHGLTPPFHTWWRLRAVRRITIQRFFLEVFYSIMIIYTPIYLHEWLKFSWSEIGIMFSIMLIPFVLLEWPVGILADKFTGEKEFMFMGFLLAFASLLAMPLLGKTWGVWVVMLFISRIGAALIEVTSESYFFKHVRENQIGIISIFRFTRTAALIIGTSIGFLVTLYFKLPVVFIFLSVVMFVGLVQTLQLKNTL